MSVAPKVPKIPRIGIPLPASGADINRINRNFWILKPALEAAGLHDSKMQRTLDTLLLEIEAGPVSAKALRAGRRSARLKKLNPPKWRAAVADRADVLRYKWPKYTPNRIANMIRSEGAIDKLPCHRLVADFIMDRFRTQ